MRYVVHRVFNTLQPAEARPLVRWTINRVSTYLYKNETRWHKYPDTLLINTRKLVLIQGFKHIEGEGRDHMDIHSIYYKYQVSSILA